MKLGTYNYGTGQTFDTHGVLLGEFPDRQQAINALHAARLLARWIGPECWGSASTNIPRLFKAEGVTP